MANGLRQCGVDAVYSHDFIQVEGQFTGNKIKGGVTLSAQHDHRIGMFFNTGRITKHPIKVSGCTTIETSQTCRKYDTARCQSGRDMIIAIDGFLQR